MNITFYGQACFLIEVAGKKLIFDPFISPNKMAAHIDVDKIEADYILITHGHEDHVADAERIARNNDCPIISSFEILSWYGAKGLKGHPMNHGGKWDFDFGTVNCVNAVHSSVLPDGTYGGNPMGFVIETAEGCFYHAGDTALTYDMKLIPMLYPKLDFAILPMGDNFTMGYAHAVIASDFIECNEIIGCHYDTFGLIEMDHNKALTAFNEKGKNLRLLDIGKPCTL